MRGPNFPYKKYGCSARDTQNVKTSFKTQLAEFQSIQINYTVDSFRRGLLPDALRENALFVAHFFSDYHTSKSVFERVFYYVLFHLFFTIPLPPPPPPPKAYKATEKMMVRHCSCGMQQAARRHWTSSRSYTAYTNGAYVRSGTSLGHILDRMRALYRCQKNTLLTK